MSKKVIIYTRVSTDEQRENGFSLQDQEHRLRQHCEKEGHEIVAHYCEDHSAKNFNRPEFKKLLSDLKSKKVKADILMCVRYDRFSRDAEASLQMIQTLAKYGVYLLTLEYNYDLSVPENRIPFMLSLLMPQVDNERRALNTKRGMRQGRKEGYWNGNNPKGYKWDRTGKRSILVPDENAKYIKLAFEELAKGVYSIDEVRRKLNKMGFECSSNNFHKLIRNVVYMGKIKIDAWQDEPEQIVQGVHEPIVSEELFETVQFEINRRKKDQAKIKKYNEDLPLRGFLLCRQCGSNLTGSASRSHTGKRHYYYHCQQGCPERFSAINANYMFIQYLASLQIRHEVLELYRHILLDVFKTNEDSKKQTIAQLNKKIKEINDLIVKLEDKFVSDELDIESYNSIKKRYTENLTNAKAEKRQLHSVNSDFLNHINYGFSLLYNLDGYYNEASIDDKHKILGSIFLEKLIFDGSNYRTPKINRVIELLLSKNSNLQSQKKKKAAKSSDLYHRASRRGVEPLLQE